MESKIMTTRSATESQASASEIGQKEKKKDTSWLSSNHLQLQITATVTTSILLLWSFTIVFFTLCEE